jgi:nicotinamide mononucleotide transporter
MYELIISWLKGNYIELLGTLFGLLYIYFSIRQKVWLWPIGLITSAFYIPVFFEKTLYADMLLQVYYVIVSLYGWYFWINGRKKDDKLAGKIKITTLKKLNWIITIAFTFVLTIVLFYPLKKYTNASNPFTDSFCFAGSIIGTWMLARKILEQWLIWIVVDGISIGLFVYKQLYITVILYIVYTVLAIIGYLQWKRDWKVQKI